MTTGTSVGAIYYEVEADTSKLVNAVKPAGDSMDKLTATFNRTDRAANQAQFQMTKTAAAVQNLGRQSNTTGTAIGGLTKLISGYLTLRTASEVLRAAEAYNEMSERIRMATNSQREYQQVQSRLLATANGTYRLMAEAQELYIRTADSLRSMGYSTAEVLDITDSMSYSFVRNATSVDRAESAIAAFTKSINKGKVEADAWESLIAAMPTIIGELATSTGRSEAEIRMLGATGKLVANDLNKTFIKSLDASKSAAEGMAVTVKDSLTALKNNLTVYIGETNQATGVTGGLSGAINSLAEAVKNADVNVLIREMEALQIVLGEVSEQASAWLGPFMGNTATAAGFMSTSFEKGALATAKEIDKLAEVFNGTIGAVQAAWGALAGNIPAFFSNAWDEVLSGAATFVNSLAGMINKPIEALGFDPIESVNWGGGSTQAIVSIADAARNGWEDAAKSLGAYDALSRRVADRAMSRATSKWVADYGEDPKGSPAGRKGAAAPANVTAAGKKAASERNRAEKENIRTLDQLAEALLQVGMSGEQLAIAQARASMNKFATAEDIKTAEDMAVALYKVHQAEEARKKVGGTAQEVEEYVFGDVKPLSGGAFDDQTERYDAEAKAEQKRYEEQLKRLQEAKAAEIQQREAYAAVIEELQTAHLNRMAALEIEKEKAKTEGDAEKLGANIALEQTQYADELARLQEHLEKKQQLQANYGAIEQKLAEENAARQAQIEKAKNQVLLSSASDAFGSLAGVMKSSAGEQSGIYKGMFAASKAFAIAESIVKIQQGIASAASLQFPTNIPAMAAVAAQTAGIVSTIQGTSYGSGRQYGGPVAPGAMHRINENGKPEIYNATNGQQFLLPNSRGEVVSNKDAMGGSAPAPKVTVTIHNAPAGTRVEQRAIGDREYILDVMIEDAVGGGRYSETNDAIYGRTRRGR